MEASEAILSQVVSAPFTGRCWCTASRGTPLAGDGKYGGGPGEIALWSYRLAFPHPETGRPLAFSSLPQGGLWEEFSLETLLSASI